MNALNHFQSDRKIENHSIAIHETRILWIVGEGDTVTVGGDLYKIDTDGKAVKLMFLVKKRKGN